MSPAVVFTADPSRVLHPLIEAMTHAQQQWPRGTLTDSEHAELRSRHALVQVVGQAYQHPAWSIHVVPPAHMIPNTHPRSVQIVPVVDQAEARRCLASFAVHLSTVGTTNPGSASTWTELGASRVCSIGEMQRPPLPRCHDGHHIIDVIWGPEGSGTRSA
jgi:hypothetical protein